MIFYQQQNFRINIDMIAAYIAVNEKKKILIYLMSGHELEWTFNNSNDRDKVLRELDNQVKIRQEVLSSVEAVEEVEIDSDFDVYI